MKRQSRGREIGRRVFSPADQQWFAEVSGDRNPIHLDAVAARRLLGGGQLVHGAHVLMSALDLLPPGTSKPATINCWFESPIHAGDEVVFHEQFNSRGERVLQAVVKSVLSSKFVFSNNVSGSTESLAACDAELLPILAQPLADEPDRHVGKCYAVSTSDCDFSKRFPNASGTFGGAVLSSIGRLSYVVGMVCPGLHSMLSTLLLDLSTPPAGDRLVVSPLKFHPTFRFVDLAFAGPVAGRAQAFVRPGAQQQPSLDEIARHVAPDEFRGTRSLILGGSRGLGELTAKILAAGGGDVTITYHAGREDAARVEAEINSHRAGACLIAPFDVSHDALSQIGGGTAQWNAVYFFPTPRIFRKPAGVFDATRLKEFSDVYVERFFALCAELEDSSEGPVSVFFPSSVAVAERPAGMTEYAMAKAAAEILIDDINRAFKKVRVIAHRLPRLSTDQTASIVDVPAASNLDTLLPIIRTMYR